MNMSLIENIHINDVSEAERILKGEDFELEKARQVGDIFYHNGKPYVWTEYAPGKFDWHVVKQSKVVRGKGINGKHGIAALTQAYADANKDYDDPKKIMLKRTPNGHWRMYYDGQDTGNTVAGDTLTEAELKADDVCYQKNNVVDNFDLVDGYMEFNNPDDVYFVQVIKRWKDNKDKPDAAKWKAQGRQKGTYHSGAEYMDYWLIHSPQELQQHKADIIKACSYNNARAYISINSRSQNQVNAYLPKFKSHFSSTDPRSKFAEPIVYGMAKSGPAWKNERFRVLVDIDTTKDSKATMPNGKSVNIWKDVKERLNKLNIKVAAEYTTPSGGLHLILNNKNNRNVREFYKGLKDYDGGRNLGTLATVHPSEDIKMVLYSNVETAGY